MFANFVNFTTMPTDLKDWILSLDLSPTKIVAAMEPLRHQHPLAQGGPGHHFQGRLASGLGADFHPGIALGLPTAQFVAAV
jgi:hypothetical protein